MDVVVVQEFVFCSVDDGVVLHSISIKNCQQLQILSYKSIDMNVSDIEQCFGKISLFDFLFPSSLLTLFESIPRFFPHHLTF